MVTLRPMTDADLQDSYIWDSDPEIRALNPPAGRMSNYQAYAIDADGKHIGACFMMNVTDESGELAIEIGDREYWGRGYGTEAVRALTQHWLSNGLKRIWLKVLPWNTRARRCYEKCGFTPAGRLILDGVEFLVMENTGK
jgi:RimJ/RimL family protein N-acetyltransferase